MISDRLSFEQFASPHDVPPQTQEALTECWVEVTNAGGAAGFPFPPIGHSEAAAAVDQLVAGLTADASRLLTATEGGELVGWLNVRRDPWALISHWGTLHHVQTHPTFRGNGHGAALMNEVRRFAREEMGLEQLHLAARAGVGLEEFYTRLGWKEIGRWPRALRLSPDDDRDEILMVLNPL